MKHPTIGFALFRLASLCYGGPGPIAETEITFQGAGPNPPEYTLVVPCNGVTFTIHNPLSVSHIISNDLTANCACTFNGIDGSITSTFENEEVDVGSPQTQVSGSCGVIFPDRKPRRRATKEVEARQVPVETITFQGAGPNPPEYSLTVPCDGSNFLTDNLLSVSQIITDGTVECACSFFGIDGSVTFTFDNDEVDVGPPQTQVSGSCSAIKHGLNPRQTATLEAYGLFFGAGPDPPTYSQYFPANGVVQPITNPLSVSQISLSDGINCTFFGVDGSVTHVSTEEPVDVGPPQAQVAGVCEPVE